MKVHEYQAKQILANYGVTIPRGKVAFTVDEAVKAAEELGTEICVVKAQIHAGGRGKGCLLYTSPSPRDRTRSRMPSSA